MSQIFKSRFFLIAIFTTFLLSQAFAQSGREYRRSAVMRGNLVKTVFGNWGVIGQPATSGARGAWIHETNGYIGDVSPMVGVEVTTKDGTTFHSVVTTPVSRPAQAHELSPEGLPWGFEPVAGYFNEAQEGVALYSDPDSWPAYWPDKMDDAEDPGWSGSWNGFFGKTTTAAEECFFLMDDNNDQEFNFSGNNQWNVDFKPDSTNITRNGLGLKVKVRGMQWSDFLAQDVIFWLYEITNTSTTDYDKVVFGMLVGTYIGCTSTDDSPHEYDDDYSFFDVEKDLTYTGDFDDDCSRNPRWVGDVGMVGYAFLESPGNPFDGIDNDGDADANPLHPGTGPFFSEDDFSPRLINAGDKVVLIDKKYNRTIVTVPSFDTTFVTRGHSIPVSPGVTSLAEGNIVVVQGKVVVNPNAYDGIDNDLDGLIDENYYLHYHQIRKDQKGNVLIDKFSPVRYKDYLTGIGLDDYLIDEQRNDGIDNDGDWNAEFDDVGADGLVSTNDNGEGDGIPTPGEPNFDQTDVDESDQIGLTSFEYFSPAGEFSMANDEELWGRLAPGFFDVPESIVNNKPEQGEDGDFIYGSGYFPLPAGETRSFSLALVYGEGGGRQVDLTDLLKNRETVQKIYNSDYRFPPAPDKPTLTVVPGDGKVTLYWDRKSELSFDPVLKTNDFEGYKIYRATDQNFNEVFTVTDADGYAIAYKPIVQFDLDDDVEGYFRGNPDLFEAAGGASFNLGDDSGLKHSYVDNDVENGRRYFYAVVAYDQGDVERDIFPKENDKRIDILPSGEVRTFQNTGVAIPNAEVAGYEPPEGSVPVTSPNLVGTGNAFYTVVDEQALVAHRYRVEFWDTANDGLDNNGNWDASTDDLGNDGTAGTNDADGSENNGIPDPGEPNVDLNDPDEYFIPITSLYSVRDLTGVTETFTARDTFAVRLENTNLIEATVEVQDNSGNTVPASKYILDAENGRIQGKSSNDLLYGESYSISYQYYPVYRSAHIEGSPYAAETQDTDIFDGIQIVFGNDWEIAVDPVASSWTDPTRTYSYTMEIIDTYFGSSRLLGLSHPSDYYIIFHDDVADTSLEIAQYFTRAIPVNFQILNKTDNRYLDFIYNDLDRNRKLSPFDELVLVEKGEKNTDIFTWDILFTSKDDTVFDYGMGDTLKLNLTKPFRRSDSFEFDVELPQVALPTEQEQRDQMLDKIRVVPNPYIVATSQELPLPPAITSGRGERKIDFIHLPGETKIHIFTTRGEHVITLEHDSGLHDGTVSWNLKTKENLDVAAGIYFYVMETSIGKKTGKIGIIK